MPGPGRIGTIVVNLDPNMAQVGPVMVTWHGLFSVLGVLVAFGIGRRLAAAEGLPRDHLYDLAIWMLLLGWLGARALYAWEHYDRLPSGWVALAALSGGGIVAWGGILGAAGAAWLWCRRSGSRFWRVVDAAGPACCAGFATGWVGDLISGAPHSIPTTLGWGLQYVNLHTLGVPGRVVQPQVGYQILWSLLVLAVMLPIRGRLQQRHPYGTAGLLYLGLFAIGTLIFAFMSTDPLVLGLRAAQWASLSALIAIGAALAVRRRHAGQDRRVILTASGSIE